MLRKQRGQGGFVFDIGAGKSESLLPSGQRIQPVLFQAHIVGIVEIIEPDHGVPGIEQQSGGTGGDEIRRRR